MQCDVWNDSRVIEIEGFVFVFTYECKCLFIDPVRRIILSFKNIVAARVSGVCSLWQRSVAGYRWFVFEFIEFVIAP